MLRPPFKIRLRPFRVILAYFGVAFFMMMIARLVFYVYNFPILFSDSFSALLYMFYGGFFFDLSILLVSNSIFILGLSLPFPFRYNKIYQKIIRYFFILPTSICLLLNILDTVYYEVTLKRTTTLVFQQFQNETNLLGLSFQFLIDYWYMLILYFLMIAFFLYLLQFIVIKKKKIINAKKYYFLNSLVFLAVIPLVVAGIRGGVTGMTRPITLSDASKYTEKPQHRALVLNTPFAIYRTLSKRPLPQVNYFDSDKKRKSFFDAYYHGDTTNSFKYKNVVLFILESFGKENSGKLNPDIKDYKGYTPYFDSLMDYAKVFANGIAHGRQSIAGTPATVASIPSLASMFILSYYSGNRINSLASKLNRMGYYTAFFHGSYTGSMGFDSFAKNAGYQDYFGMEDYGDLTDFDGNWGIFDEEFFQFFSDKMDKMKPPFFTTFFSLSSHHPYVVPDKYKDKFSKGKLPLHPTIEYVDFALNKFLKKASQSNWYDNTLFIFTADHAPSFSFLPEYKNILGYHSVPLVFFEPGTATMRGYNDSTFVQQSDIMPTVLNYLKYPHDYISFGKPLFDQNMDIDWAVCYNVGGYYLFSNQHAIVFDGKQITTAYNLNTDKQLQHNIKNQMSDSLLYALENKIKAFVQDLNNRKIKNRMTVKTSQK